MKKIFIVFLFIFHVTLVLADQYQELYNNGEIAQLRDDIYSKAYFEKSELPRAAYYESLVTSKDFDQTLQELIERFPEMEYKDQVNFKLAIINFFKRRYSQSEFYFSKIEKSSQIPEYHYWLSRLYFMKQEHKQSSSYASMFIEQCDKTDHKFELSYYMLIENSISQGNFQKAIVLAEELIRNKPEGINKAYLYYRIGYSYQKVDNLPLALENYRISFIEDPYGQYASIIEENLFELKKSVDSNLDIAFLYTKNYASDDVNNLEKSKTTTKSFNIVDLVRTDTSSVLSKFFANDYEVSPTDKIPLEPNNPEKFNNTNLDNQQFNENNNREEVHDLPIQEVVVSHDALNQETRGRREDLPLSNTPKDNINDNGSFIDRLNNIDNGTMIDRPNNIQTEDYIYLMNKPKGKYYIQIGRFSKKEYAINRVKELFYLDRNWNIIRDVQDNNISYVIWSQPYETATLAKRDIAYFKSKKVDCFLIANE